MEDILKSLNDTRISKFLDLSNSTSMQYIGLMNGVNSAGASIVLANYSLAGTVFREDSSSSLTNSLGITISPCRAAEKLIVADGQTLYENRSCWLFNIEYHTSYLLVQQLIILWIYSFTTNYSTKWLLT
jgi:Na+/serine symporter